jgi:methyl-accepting chemotaxis protein
MRCNTENAEKVDELTRQARQATDTAATDREDMSKAMSAIKESGSEIARIIKSIDEIAPQARGVMMAVRSSLRCK